METNENNNRQKLLINIDGASRGNPGDAGVGVVICDEKGEIIAEKKGYLGKATNNVAEYEAFLLALKEAKTLGAAHLEIYTDSELLARQWNGQYRVKSPHLISLMKQARELSRFFKSCSLIHVPRELNKRADALANMAIDDYLANS